jgi:group I intron endonuclease
MNTKQAGIYSITSKVNGKRYVGSAARICDRWKWHLRDLRANKHHSPYLQNHYNKYGENDLVFTVLEVVERGELTLQDFKQLLLDREQVYLDNWNECQFNCLPTAGSNLGYKFKGGKYYKFENNLYRTSYTVQGKQLNFSYHYTEEEAIKEVEYLKTLTDEELLEYKEECLAKPPRDGRADKHYDLQKASNMFRVRFNSIHFNLHHTEEEAIKEVEYLKTLTNDELLKYKEECLAKPKRRKKTAKYYTYFKRDQCYRTFYIVSGKCLRFNSHSLEEEAIKEVEYLKTLSNEELIKFEQDCRTKPKTRKQGKNYNIDKYTGRFRVEMYVNGKNKYFGSYLTEQEAIDRVKQVRKELGIE